LAAMYRKDIYRNLLRRNIGEQYLYTKGESYIEMH